MACFALVAALLFASVSSQPAWAKETVTKNINSGDVTCNDPNVTYVVNGSHDRNFLYISGGSQDNPVEVIFDNLTMDQSGWHSASHAPVKVESGYCVIKLRGTSTIKGGFYNHVIGSDSGKAGIRVDSGATLVITSEEGDGSTEGKLIAVGRDNGSYGGSGIGGDYNDNIGNIVIKGGTIDAAGGANASGIGAGRDGYTPSIVIEGGNITARGGEYSAGIGGGDHVGVGGDGGNVGSITIKNATVWAQGGSNGGAGIGGSEGGSVDRIAILSGSITAIGGSDGAGIGGGSGSDVNFVYIDQDPGSELNIHATGGSNGAGIGSAKANGVPVSITLRGGSIYAEGGHHGAGIGGGAKQNGKITIKGEGEITAKCGVSAASIGAGNQCHSGPIEIEGTDYDEGGPDYGEGAVYSLKITCLPSNGNDDNSREAAVIGAGDGSGDDISIANADLYLDASDAEYFYGAFIGTGHSEDASLHDGGMDIISLKHCRVRLKYGKMCYGAGIGAAFRSSIDYIDLDRVDYEGHTIGNSVYALLAYDNNHIKGISIDRSKITAHALETSGKDNWAGIGTGPYGTVDQITISRSEVDALGRHGAAAIGSGGLKYGGRKMKLREIWSMRGKVGSIDISNHSTVTAVSEEGAAAIGSGYLTSVTGRINIEGFSTVYANANGGDQYRSAGIGAGLGAGCEEIRISGSTVKATGGKYAAAIGSGGVEDNILTSLVEYGWLESLGSITIMGESDVTVQGGPGAAGIGTGQGMSLSGTIKIDDSTVNATGGTHGAGIGGGAETALNKGGDVSGIRILGRSAVTATGGQGAAGIGGGYSGGVEDVVIDITMDPACYVKAQGGEGAAGIGGGTMTGDFLSMPKDGEVTINSGYVYAKGGSDYNSDDPNGNSEYHPGGWLGAGAGIGGGAGGGNGYVTITGGIVDAHAGNTVSSRHSAKDIGDGGNNYQQSSSLMGHSNTSISGGTVLSGLTESDNPRIDGGSVKHQIGGADNADPTAESSNGTKLSQATLTLTTQGLTPVEFNGQTFYKIDSIQTDLNGFGGKDLYALATGENRAQLYLYLPRSAQDKAVADLGVTCNGASQQRHYWGTVGEENNNVLKMGYLLSLVPENDLSPADVAAGYLPDAFIGHKLRLNLQLANDSGFLTDEQRQEFEEAYGVDLDTMVAEYSIASDAGASAIIGDETKGQLPMSFAAVSCGDEGEGAFTVSAKVPLVDANMSDVYWDAEALYSAKPRDLSAGVAISVSGDLTKEYDAKPVENPDYFLTYDGAYVNPDYDAPVSFAYEQKVGDDFQVLEEGVVPVEIGEYRVTAFLTNSPEVSDSLEFKITVIKTKVVAEAVSKRYDGIPVEAVVTVTSEKGATDVEFGAAGASIRTQYASYNSHNLRTTMGDIFQKSVEQDGALIWTYEYRNGSPGEQEVVSKEEFDYPVKPGTYEAVVDTMNDPHFQKMMGGTDIVISKAAPVLENIRLTSLFWEEGCSLSDKNEELAQVVPVADYDETVSVPGTWKWIAQGEDESWQVVDPATVVYEKDDTGVKVYRVLFIPNDEEIYERGTAYVTFSVDEKPAPEIQVSCASKTYDGTPIEAPSVETDSEGAQSVVYYRADDDAKTPLAAPAEAGRYVAEVTVAESKTHAEGVALAEFSIMKRPVTLSVNTQVNNGSGDATITVSVQNAVPTLVGATIDVVVELGDGTTVTKKATVAQGGSAYGATVTVPNVPVGTHKVTATLSDERALKNFDAAPCAGIFTREASPVDPDDPDGPSDPNGPDNTVNPSDSGDNGEGGSKIVATGDSSLTFATFFALMLVASAGTLLLRHSERSDRRERSRRI